MFSSVFENPYYLTVQATFLLSPFHLSFNQSAKPGGPNLARRASIMIYCLFLGRGGGRPLQGEERNGVAVPPWERREAGGEGVLCRIR